MEGLQDHPTHTPHHSRPSKEGISKGYSEYLSPDPSRACPQFVASKKLQYMLYFRLATFFIIEAGFIVLAAMCLKKPIPLNIPFKVSSSEVRGGVTIILIIWQSLAAIVGAYIFTDAFSREWSTQPSRLVPGESDRVSTITSSFLDRILYFFTQDASGTFKIAFLTSLCLMVLTQLAPGTISAETTLVDLPLTIQVGNLVAQVGDAAAIKSLLNTGSRAALITRLEHIEKLPFGLNVETGRIVAWPSVKLGDLNGTLEYDTDVVEFHYDCHWEAPRFLNSSAGVLIAAANQGWAGDFVFGTGIPASSISPLSLISVSDMQSTNLSAFLFIGGNSTLLNNSTSPPIPFAINIGTLPSTFVPLGVGISGPGQDFIGPLASVLVCDPHPQISGGRVSLATDGSLKVIQSGLPATGNIPPSAANIIFTSGLSVSIQDLDVLETTNIVNDIAATMFMQNSSVDWGTARNNSPLDLPSINKNMDSFMLSASKAFSDGYRKDGSSTTASFSLTQIPAAGQEQRLVLTASLGLFITVIVFVAIALVLLYTLCRSTLTQQRYPFDLHNVVTVLQEEAVKRASIIQGSQH